jgi:hypothetical protein
MSHFRTSVAFSLIASVFGMLVIVVLALNPPINNFSIAWRRPLVGTLFAALCATGIIAAFLPKTCSAALNHHGTKNQTPNAQKRPEKIMTRKAHHPDCGRFASHTVRIGNTTGCAACFGLAIGASIALAGTAMYFFFGVDLVQADVNILFAGQIAVAFGLGQFKLRGYTRLVLNSIFVLGAFFTLVEIDRFTENVIADIYLLAIIVVWIFTRILLSQWDHDRICCACTERCGIVGEY